MDTQLQGLSYLTWERHHRIEVCYINVSILDYACPYAESLLYNSVVRITIYTVVSNTKSDVVVN